MMRRGLSGSFAVIALAIGAGCTSGEIISPIVFARPTSVTIAGNDRLSSVGGDSLILTSGYGAQHVARAYGDSLHVRFFEYDLRFRRQ